jgi:formylglycine-generating enzyme required for sulfatase activity
MIKYFFILFSLLFAGENYVTAQKKTPPGTIRINDSLYIDKHPVTNIEYAAFLYCVGLFWNHAFSDSINRMATPKVDMEKLQRQPNKDLQWRINQQALINRMQIDKTPYKFIDTALNLQQYLTHPRLRDFPVVGISLEQAVTFCKWRSDMIRIAYAQQNNTERKQRRHYQWVQYRLPLSNEWMTAYKTRGITGKRRINTNMQAENKEKQLFVAYPFPVTEWTEPNDHINKLSLNSNDVVTDMTVPPAGTITLQMSFRCSCDVK